MSRRALLAGSLGVVVASAGAGVGVNLRRRSTGTPPGGTSPAGAAPVVRTFLSRPDIQQPVVTVTTPAPAGVGGYLLLTPATGAGLRGPMMVDVAGNLVWAAPLTTAGHSATNFQVQQYQGRPVLTWWQGVITSRGVGAGELVMLDTSYREVARLQVGGAPADLHEFVLTPAGTALCLTYEEITADLTPVGGTATAPMFDGVVHEIDVATGRTLFTWRASEHVRVDESYQPIDTTVPSPSPAGSTAGANPAQLAVGTAPPVPAQPLAYDYLHLNSVGLDSDGNLLLSARHTSTVYKVDRSSGAVLWRLGGKRSDFTFGDQARFWYQHDARRRPDGRLSVFDNGAGITTEEKVSRGLVLTLDESARTATLAHEFPQPDGESAGTQGSVRLLSGGGTFIGWGVRPSFTEYSAQGGVVLAGHLPPDNSSYRAIRADWTGHPTGAPTVVVPPADGPAVGYVSWNGATDVTGWRVLAGPGPDTLAPAGTVPRRGFETSLPLPAGAAFVGVEALGGDGATLGRSATVAAAR